MAQCLPQKEHFPTLAKEVLESAVRDVKAQYTGKHTTFAPQVVYLAELPSYNEFFAKFLVPNQLCVLTEAATRQWRSRQDWVCEDGSPNFDFLQHAFGNATVPVANCKSKEFSAHTKQEMKMSEFLTYWRQYREAGHPATDNSWYLKDWHFTRDFPDYNAYSTCSFFRSDWMNEFWDTRKDVDDDYRFVYMGPKNTWTPFHADVFRSYSWSANICGQKRWIFFPPGEEEHLKDIHNSLVYDVTTKELEDPGKFPNAHKAEHRIEIIQHPGETIFVPSGWHHQVENLEDTISINHNWLNGCNVRQCWAHLKASLADVEQEISDCRDMDGWDQQCQTILRALTGLDYKEFLRFMESVARRRIQALSSWKQKVTPSTCDSTAFPCTPHNADLQHSPSEALTSPTGNGEGFDDTSAQHHQYEEDALNLSEGAVLNGQDLGSRHWSYCNVNHALFDLASIALVLQDIQQHTSLRSVPEVEDHVAGKDKNDTHVDLAASVWEEGKKRCTSQYADENCSEISECPKESISTEFLLEEISQCLSAFGVEGKWKL